MPKAYVYPFINPHNKYTEIQKETLKACGYEIMPIRKIANPITAARATGKDICVLNWIESKCVSEKGSLCLKGTLYTMLILAILSLSPPRTYWIKHNHKPHNAGRKSARIGRSIARALEIISYRKVLHADIAHSNNGIYIPHPLYEESGPLNSNYNTRPTFVCVGAVAEYKGLSELLMMWPEGQELKIHGPLQSQSYGKKLTKIASERKLNVEFRFDFIPENQLKDLLNKTDALIIAHKPNSAIVSGSFFLAKSYGLAILCKEGSMTIPVKTKMTFNFSSNISQTIHDACKEMGKSSKIEVFRESKRLFGESAIKSKWKSILKNQQSR